MTTRRGARIGATLAGLLLADTTIPAATAQAPAPAAQDLPSHAQWKQDVRKATAGSVRYVRKRIEHRKPGKRLALNLDIDNTALASHYDNGKATRSVLRTARVAARGDVAILFNTARPRSKASAAVRQLRRAGYRVDAICTRKPGAHQTVGEGKRACRRKFVRQGYTIIANIGNRRTDFTGGNYDRAYRLPNYGGRLT